MSARGLGGVRLSSAFSNRYRGRGGRGGSGASGESGGSDGGGGSGSGSSRWASLRGRSLVRRSSPRISPCASPSLRSSPSPLPSPRSGCGGGIGGIGGEGRAGSASARRHASVAVGPCFFSDDGAQADVGWGNGGIGDAGANGGRRYRSSSDPGGTSAGRSAAGTPAEAVATQVTRVEHLGVDIGQLGLDGGSDLNHRERGAIGAKTAVATDTEEDGYFPMTDLMVMMFHDSIDALDGDTAADALDGDTAGLDGTDDEYYYDYYDGYDDSYDPVAAVTASVANGDDADTDPDLSYFADAADGYAEAEVSSVNAGGGVDDTDGGSDGRAAVAAVSVGVDGTTSRSDQNHSRYDNCNGFSTTNAIIAHFWLARARENIAHARRQRRRARRRRRRRRTVAAAMLLWDAAHSGGKDDGRDGDGVVAAGHGDGGDGGDRSDDSASSGRDRRGVVTCGGGVIIVVIVVIRTMQMGGCPRRL